MRRPRTWSTRCGSTQTPWLASAPYIAAIWIGVTAIPWPIGTLPIVDPDPLPQRQDDPGALAGKVDPGRAPEAEPRDPRGQPLRANQLGEHHRADVRRPGDGGRVLLSSHLLAEIEIIADDIVMIGQGRIVCQGSKADLLRVAGTVVRAADTAALEHALDGAGVTATFSGDGSLRTDADPARVGRAAYDGGVVLTELRTADSGGLEEMFLELTADTQRDTASERSAA